MSLREMSQKARSWRGDVRDDLIGFEVSKCGVASLRSCSPNNCANLRPLTATYRILVSAPVTGAPTSYRQLILFFPHEDTDTGNAAVIHSIAGET